MSTFTGIAMDGVETVDGLQMLPAELVDKVCQHLDLRDLQNVRLSCKHLYHCSVRQFGIANFGVVPVMLLRHSFKSLMEIASHERYRACVQEIQVTLHTFPPLLIEGIDGHSDPNDETHVPFRPVKRRKLGKQTGKNKKDVVRPDFSNAAPNCLKRERRRAFGRYSHEQDTLRTQAEDLQFLLEAIQAFPALKSISIIPAQDAPHAWGYKKVQQDIGMGVMLEDTLTLRYNSWHYFQRKQFDSYAEHMMRHVLALVLGAISKSSKLLTQEGSVSLCLPQQFRYPKTAGSRKNSRTPAKTFSEEDLPGLQRALASVTDLRVWNFMEHNPRAYFPPAQPDSSFTWTSSLTHLWPSVERLSISGQKNVKQVHIFDIAKGSEGMGALRCLEILSMPFDYSELKTLIERNRTTLESVRIADCDASIGLHYVSILEMLLDCPRMASLILDGNWIRKSNAFFIPYYQRPRKHNDDQAHFQLSAQSHADFYARFEEHVRNSRAYWSRWP